MDFVLRGILIITFCTFGKFFVFSQRDILVLDIDNKSPISFVKIVPDVGRPFFTDIDGKARIENDQVQYISLFFSGYNDTLVFFDTTSFYTIYMQLHSKELGEVVVVPGENPAHRIIKKVSENRKLNHPLGKDAFTYESYSKFVVDIDSASLSRLFILDSTSKEQQGDSISKIDSYMINLFKNQNLFMMESASNRTYIPPARDREEITAYKVSGFKNPIFSAFAQSMQSFHFYDNRFKLLGKEYFNPIALGGINRYFFLLEDSVVVNNDTTFLISFRPKPNTGVETMKGILFINTNGYAIEKVIAQPSQRSEDEFYLKITQEYQLIDNKKWFPKDLKTDVSFGNILNFENPEPDIETKRAEGRGSTYIKNIVLNPSDVKKKGFNNVALSTDPKAAYKSEEYWQQVRKDSITEREQNTYTVIDSLSKAHKLERKIDGLLTLTTGRMRIKYIAIPLDRIIHFNLHEGYRLGAGVESSDLVMRNIILGTYFAYGTRDKEWKYGGYSTVHINRRWGMNFGMRFQQDLIERGGNEFVKKDANLFSSDIYTQFYRYHLDKQRLAEVSFSVKPRANLTVNVLTNYQRIEFTQQYVFTDRNNLPLHKLELTETAIEAHWNIREKVIFVGDLRIPQSTAFPRIKFRIAKGWTGFEKSKLDYWRFFLSMNEDIKSLRFGEINLYAHFSQTIGDVPLTFKQNLIGTRHELGVVTKDVLETAFPSEFYHDRQATLISRYFFPQLSFFKGKFTPQIGLHHGIGYGEMSKDTQHNIPFKIMNKGLFEAGLIIKKILVLSSYSKIGVGVFYRYGEYAQTDASKNVVVKVDLSF